LQADERAEEDKKKALMTKIAHRLMHAPLAHAFERWQVATHICIHMYIYEYMCIYIYTFTYYIYILYIHMYIYIYTYIHFHITSTYYTYI